MGKNITTEETGRKYQWRFQFYTKSRAQALLKSWHSSRVKGASRTYDVGYVSGWLILNVSISSSGFGGLSASFLSGSFILHNTREVFHFKYHNHLCIRHNKN